MSKIELKENYFGLKDWVCSTCGKIFSELTKFCPFCDKKEINQENLLEKSNCENINVAPEEVENINVAPEEVKMNKETIRKQVKDTILKFLGFSEEDIENYKEDIRIVEDLGADSLDCVEIIMELEETFDIAIPDDDVYDKKESITIGNVVDYIYNKKNRKK